MAKTSATIADGYDFNESLILPILMDAWKFVFTILSVRIWSSTDYIYDFEMKYTVNNWIQ